MQLYQIPSYGVPVDVLKGQNGQDIYTVDSKTQQFADFLVSLPTQRVILHPKLFLGQPGPNVHAVIKAHIECNDGKKLVLRVKANHILNWNDTPPFGNRNCLIRPDADFFAQPGTWVIRNLPLIVCEQRNEAITGRSCCALSFPPYLSIASFPCGQTILDKWNQSNEPVRAVFWL